ncbi:hypothetical protein HMPREF1861_01676 [Corynebacterium kroppenstedtii]|nr:hypothetical protein HMPREF1861_01676 [Corynebacterium kroppenstedtii]
MLKNFRFCSRLHTPGAGLPFRSACGGGSGFILCVGIVVGAFF